MTDPQIFFHGAARSVTGSCFRLETEAGQVLIDCGMFQGSKTEKELNYRPLPFDPGKIAAVILSHAHIDHSGLLPKLTRHGFDGPIHATQATADLAGVMLPDSAHIQEFEVAQFNRRAARRNMAPVAPIYTGSDAQACLKRFHPQSYDTWFTVLPGVRARLWNAGHLLGSASVEVEIARGAVVPLRLLFSADIGPNYKLLQPDPQGPSGVDYLICEATYGDQERGDATADRRRALLADEVRQATQPNGALLIPSFAVERAQELISDLGQLMADGALPTIPIYVDSPLASAATKVFAKNHRALDDGAGFMASLHAPHLHFTEATEESIALDRVQGFHIVIAASGMCDAGRIRHRLKNWIWRDTATVLLVGFQAEGSLGRILLNGAQAVRIQGEEFAVRARIRSLDLYAGHADATELLAWGKARMPVRRGLFLVHGEDPAMAALAARLSGVVPDGAILRPVLDQGFTLTDSGAVPVAPAPAPRLAPEQIAHLDWHNDVSRLFLGINAALTDCRDEKARNVLIRRLNRALEDAPQKPRHGHRNGKGKG